MAMYDRILLPTDGSRGTAAVAEHALSLAERYDAALHALYVVDEEGMAWETGEETARMIEALESEGEEATGRIGERASDRGIDAVGAIERGTPHRAILEYAEREGIDLIVMGTHGRRGVNRFLLGSVTERIVRLSAVPVLTVRLPRGAVVTDAETAREIATDALEREGHEAAAFPEEPYRESSTWIVRVESADGGTFNVHIDATTRDARVARID